MMFNQFFDIFHVKIQPKHQNEFHEKLRLNNAEKVLIISGLGVFFFILLSALDIQRIVSGEYYNFWLYPALSVTHLLLLFLLFPGILIYRNYQKIKEGLYPFTEKLINYCLVVMGLSLVPMSILGTYDKRGLVTFSAYIIISNLILTLTKKTRIWINGVSAFFVVSGIIWMHWSDLETMFALIIECLGITLPVYIIANYQFSLRIKQFNNEKLVQQALTDEYTKKIAEIEMTALRAQMNPHFLFNVLNSIKLYMVQNDAATASRYLTKFARLIRLILNNSKSRMVVLSDELRALELYIEIEQFRFNNKFDFTMEVAEDVETALIEIPPLILQPYVENAIWHGLMHKDKGRGKLRIDTRKSNGLIQFTIEDNGIGREKTQALKTQFGAKHESVGMQITEDRITTTNKLYGTKASVKVIDLKDVDNKSLGTRVIIKLPIS